MAARAREAVSRSSGPLRSSLPAKARVGRRDGSHENTAQTQAGAIAGKLSPLARAPRTQGGAIALPQSVANDVGRTLGADLAHIRLHDGDQAASLASSARARAFALDGDIVFGRGQFDPGSARGRELIAHELAHAANPLPGVIQRDPDKPTGVVRMHFNGDELIVYDGDKEKFRFSGQSGRPVLLKPEDAKACGGDPLTETYMNNKKFVGVEDNGPIPEGTYRLDPKAIQTWGLLDELDIMTTGHSKTVKTPAGNIGGGDWGEGRVPLSPVSRKDGPCGNTQTRHSFYLHGGWAAGSSGCIDIGTKFDQIADFLHDYKKSVTVTVAYEKSPGSVRAWTGFTGALAYGKFGFGLDATVGAGVEVQGTAKRFTVSPQVDAVMKWAGGALRAGVRLDVPLNDKETFVRVGLQGGVESRVFGALYAQLYGGYAFPLTDPNNTAKGGYMGGGLRYDLGRVELGLIYDHLWTAQQANPDVNRALITLGFNVF